MTGIIRTRGGVQIGCMDIPAGGVVGYHQATVRQLFMVVAGSGWVTTTDRQPVVISSGQAAYWQEGEWHESGSETGMTVIVIEGETIDPLQMMKEVVPDA